MSFITRLLNGLRSRSLDRDLRDEVAFHIDMRADQHQRSGLDREEAMKRAREQFGDVDTVTTGMRRARVTSIAALVTISSLFLVLIVVWISQNQRRSTSIPTVPGPPASLYGRHLGTDHTPPPPPPPPTREQCLEQARKIPRVCQ